MYTQMHLLETRKFSYKRASLPLLQRILGNDASLCHLLKCRKHLFRRMSFPRVAPALPEGALLILLLVRLIHLRCSTVPILLWHCAGMDVFGRPVGLVTGAALWECAGVNIFGRPVGLVLGFALWHCAGTKLFGAFVGLDWGAGTSGGTTRCCFGWRAAHVGEKCELRSCAGTLATAGKIGPMPDLLMRRFSKHPAFSGKSFVVIVNRADVRLFVSCFVLFLKTERHCTPHSS